MNDLTVAICMYNAGKYIQQTLDAVLNQTLRNFDLLILDDNSSDNSLKIAREYLQGRDIKVDFVEFTENHGVAYTRNEALHITKTKYLVFVDADDLPHPDMIEKEYNLLISDPDLMGVTSWTRFVDNELVPIGGGQHFGEKDKYTFIEKAKAGKRIFLPIHTIFERECAIRVGGYTIDGFPKCETRYRDYCEDLDLWTRMSDLYIEGKAIIGIQEYLYDYRKIDGLSSNHFNMIIRMDHVKFNVRRRRQGMEDVSFIEYMEGLSPSDIAKLKKDSKCADNFRNGVFYIEKKHYGKGILLLLRSFLSNPEYIKEKLLRNL